MRNKIEAEDEEEKFDDIDGKAEFKYEYGGKWYDGYSRNGDEEFKYEYGGTWYDGYSRNKNSRNKKSRNKK